jgi:acyl carrier protein
MNSTLESQLTALIASTLHVDQAAVRPDATLAGDLGADSLDMVSLILAIEDEFRVDIHDEEAAELLTVVQVIEYVSFAIAAKESTVAGRSNSGGALSLR